MDVDLRLLRYFLVLAEELHFTRAAERLYVSQPALSNQIRRLERRLGLTLFDRTARGVVLTPAGQALVPRAQQAVAAVAAGIAEAATAAGAADLLRIDLLSSSLDTPRGVLGVLRRSLPAVRLEVTSSGTAGHNRRLLSGELDLALSGEGAPAGDGIVAEVIRREPVGVSLPAGHRLATSRTIDLADLAGEVHYLPRDGFAPEWNTFVLATYRRAGFSPRRHPASTDSTETAMDLVGSGECIALSLLSTQHPPGTVVRPVTGAPAYAWTLRWRRTTPSPPRIVSARAAILAHTWT